MNQEQKETHLKDLYDALRQDEKHSMVIDGHKLVLEVIELSGAMYLTSESERHYVIWCSPSFEQYISGAKFRKDGQMTVDFEIEHDGELICEVSVPFETSWDSISGAMSLFHSALEENLSSILKDVK